VVSRKEIRDDSEVVVAFNEAGIKKLSLNFAPLKKIE